MWGLRAVLGRKGAQPRSDADPGRGLGLSQNAPRGQVVLGMRRHSRTAGSWLPGSVWCPANTPAAAKSSCSGSAKRGDTYLRTLLIHGARSVLLSLKRRAGRTEGWLARLAARRNPNIAAVALANKNARIIWALLVHERDYQAGYGAAPAEAAA